MPEGFELSCRASIRQIEAQYVANGSTLTLSAGGASQTFTRTGAAAGSSPLYGTWILPAAPIDGDPAYIARTGLGIHATAVIDATSITTIVDCSSNWVTLHARASSPITVDGSTFTIVENHEQLRKWTAAGGDQVVSTTSFPVFGAPETKSGVRLGATFPERMP